MKSTDINRQLKDTFGLTQEGRPWYRLVWSTTELEKRRGEFETWHGPLFIRREFGVKEVPKYPFYPDRWVLEKFMHHDRMEVLNDLPGTYEPIFVFDNNGTPLEPTWKVVEFILHALLNGPRLTPADVEREEREFDEREEEQLKMIMENESPYIASMLHDREAIINPGVPKE